MGSLGMRCPEDVGEHVGARVHTSRTVGMLASFGRRCRTVRAAEVIEYCASADMPECAGRVQGKRSERSLRKCYVIGFTTAFCASERHDENISHNWFVATRYALELLQREAGISTDNDITRQLSIKYG